MRHRLIQYIRHQFLFGYPHPGPSAYAGDRNVLVWISICFRYNGDPRAKTCNFIHNPGVTRYQRVYEILYTTFGPPTPSGHRPAYLHIIIPQCRGDVSNARQWKCHETHMFPMRQLYYWIPQTQEPWGTTSPEKCRAAVRNHIQESLVPKPHSATSS